MKQSSIKNLMRVWNLVKGLTGAELIAMQQRDFRIAVAGDIENRHTLIDTLGGKLAYIAEFESVGDARSQYEKLILDADDPLLLTPQGFNDALTNLIQSADETRIAIAAKLPVFRPFVVEYLSRDWSMRNGKLAAMSALPGIIPVLDFLLPATAAGDMLLLTRNQMTLLLEISACFDLPPDPKARLTELIPVVGSAFGWRAVARELVGLVPGGVGVAVKAGVAYAGTYAIGRAAGYFYATGGGKLDMTRLFQTTLADAVKKGRSLIGSIDRPK